MTKTGWLTATAMIVLITTISLSTLSAQERRAMPDRAVEAKEVTLSGTLVDLQYYMSGKFVGKSAEDCARACIRRGVPAVLDTGEALFVLGMAKGTSSKLAAFAMNRVEVTGGLYEKQGLKYLKVNSIKPLKSAEPEPGEDEYGDEDEPEDEPDDDPDDPGIPEEFDTP